MIKIYNSIEDVIMNPNITENNRKEILEEFKKLKKKNKTLKKDNKILREMVDSNYGYITKEMTE